MPTYQYACTVASCGHQFDTVQAFSDSALTECPQCSGRLRKVWGSIGVVFKGSGFYRNDSRENNRKNGDGKNDSRDNREAKESKGSKDAKDTAASGKATGDTSAGNSTKSKSDSGTSTKSSSSPPAAGSSSGSKAKPAAAS